MAKSFADLNDHILAEKVLKKMLDDQFEAIKRTTKGGGIDIRNMTATYRLGKEKTEMNKQRMEEYVEQTFGFKVTGNGFSGLEKGELPKLLKHVLENDIKLPEGQFVNKVERKLNPNLEVDYSQISFEDGYKILKEHLKKEFNKNMDFATSDVGLLHKTDPSIELRRDISDKYHIQVHVDDAGDISFKDFERIFEQAQKMKIKVPNLDSSAHLRDNTSFRE